MEKEKLWYVELSDEEGYNIFADTEEEAFQIALRYWTERIPNCFIKEYNKEENEK